MSVSFIKNDTASKLTAVCLDNDTKELINLTGSTVKAKYTIGAGALQTKTMTIVPGSTTTTGSTTSSIVLVSGGGSKFKIGEYILISGETTKITGKTGDTLSVSPALSAAPASGVAVSGSKAEYKFLAAELSAVGFIDGQIEITDAGGLVLTSVKNFVLEIGDKK